MNTLRKFSPLVSAAISVLVIILGLIVFISACTLPDSLSVSNTYVSSYSFGADFYTEMYNVTYKAVDQLKNIADGMETGFGRVMTCLCAVAKGIGVLVMSIGLLSLGRCVPSVLEMIPEKKTKTVEAAEQPAVEVAPIQFAEPAEAAEETVEEAETVETAEEVENA